MIPEPLVELATERLRLREPQPADAADLCAYYRRNAERFAPWEPERADSVEAHAAWIAAYLERRRKGQELTLLAHDAQSDELAGVVTLSALSRGGEAMLAYAVDGAYEGRSVAFEAVRAAAAYGFDRLGVGALVAHYHPDNARSGRLLQRLGFTVIASTPAIPGFERLMRPQVLARLDAATWASRAPEGR